MWVHQISKARNPERQSEHAEISSTEHEKGPTAARTIDPGWDQEK
jgi:hypothetical protein